MALVERNQRLIEDISRRGGTRYVDLPGYYKAFDYPVSLELAEHVGKRYLDRETLDPVEAVVLLATKFYTRIQATKNPAILDQFLLREKPDKLTIKSGKLVAAVKQWVRGEAHDQNLAMAIETFCEETFGVRIPTASFILRMLAPDRFGTIDVHVVNALRTLGFSGIKSLPDPNTRDAQIYLRQFRGQDYLDVNALLTEIGRHYDVADQDGMKPMWPSQVDMALYAFDKTGPRKPFDPSSQQKRDKIAAILEVVQEIYEGAKRVAQQPWAKLGEGKRIEGAAAKLYREMAKLAQEGNFDGMFRYYENTLHSDVGRRVGRLLEQSNEKSVESEYARVKTIFFDG